MKYIYIPQKALYGGYDTAGVGVSAWSHGGLPIDIPSWYTQKELGKCLIDTICILITHTMVMLPSFIHSAAHAAQKRRADASTCLCSHTCLERVHKIDQMGLYSRNVVSVTRDGAGSFSYTRSASSSLLVRDRDAASPSSAGSSLFSLLCHTLSLKLHSHAQYKHTQLALARRQAH